MKNRKPLVVLLVLAAAVAVVLAARGGFGRSRGDPGRIRVSGTIEVTDAEVSFKIAGRVEARLVSEGDRVTKGQEVARLDRVELVQEAAARKAEVQAAEAVLAELEAGSRPEEIAQAEAAAQRVKARLAELEAGSRPQEVAAAEAALQRAKAEADYRKADVDRQSALHKQGVIANRELEAARAAVDAAEAQRREAEERLKLVREGPRAEEVEQARAALKEAGEKLALVRKGPREETIRHARARLEQARATLSLAEIRLGYAALVSPLAGVVLSENIEAGEYVAPGTPVVTVGDLERVWLRAYIGETDLGRVKIGQTVRVTTDSYPGKSYEGRLAFVASDAEFTPKNVQTEKERVKLVYRIKVDVPNPSIELKPGMPADAEIRLNEASR